MSSEIRFQIELELIPVLGRKPCVDEIDAVYNSRYAADLQSGDLDLTPSGSFKSVYYNLPVASNVVENDVVKNVINQGNGQAPLKFVLCSADPDWWAIIGIAKNVSGGFADIYVNGIVDGLDLGAFIGVEYYVDPANPGKLTWVPPSIADPIKVGRSLDGTSLILMPHQQRQFCQAKGALYTSDGNWDDIISVGSDGNVLVAKSSQAFGLQWLPAVVAASPLTYTTATRALSIATSTDSASGAMSAADHTILTAVNAAKHNAVTIGATANGLSLSTQVLSLAAATNSVPGALTAADHTTYSGYAATIALKANSASPVFTGEVDSSTGNVKISTLGKGLQVKTGTNSKIGTATLVAGTILVLNSSITANSLIFLTAQTSGGTPGFLRISAKVNATSFTILSSSALDTSVVAWHIVESIP